MKQQLYSHLPSISKTTQVRWIRYARTLLKCIIMVMNRSLYHMLEHDKWPYSYVLSSRTLLWLQHWKKLMNTRNSVLVHNTKVYSLLQFVSCHQEKESEYESWVDCVSMAKRNNMSWGERKSRHRPWIFFLYFLVLMCLFTGFVFTGFCLV